MIILGEAEMFEMTSANSSSSTKVAVVIRSLAAFMVILSLGLWPAPEGAMADGQPFSSLGSFLLYRYQTIAVGLLAMGAAVTALLIARAHFAQTAQIHTREMAIADERHRLELEYRENVDLLKRMDRTRKEAKDIADLARAVAGELSTSVNSLWIRVQALHDQLAQSATGIGDGQISPNSNAHVNATNTVPAPVIFPIVANKLGFLGWDLAAEITTFHSRSESVSTPSFERDGFKVDPHRQGVAMLRHALHGAILQNRLQNVTRQIDNGKRENFETSLDAQALGDLYRHFGLQENGEIDPERWEQFASVGENGDATLNEICPAAALSDKPDSLNRAML